MPERSRTAVAVATALGLAATTLAAPAAHAEAPAKLDGGTVSWPIKKSFLRYIQGSIAQGSITPSDGAQVTKDGESIVDLVFPVDAAASEIKPDGSGVIDLKGAVKFLGHKGHGGAEWGLELEYSDLKVHITDGTKGVLTADYRRVGALPGKTPDTATGDDQPIVSFTMAAPLKPGDDLTFKGGSPTTTVLEHGEKTLLQYKKNDVLEDGPITLDLAFAKGQTPTPPTSQKSSLPPVGIAGIVLAIVGLLGGLASLLGAIPGLKLPGLR